jgi:hypothetical protein
MGHDVRIEDVLAYAFVQCAIAYPSIGLWVDSPLGVAVECDMYMCHVMHQQLTPLPACISLPA